MNNIRDRSRSNQSKINNIKTVDSNKENANANDEAKKPKAKEKNVFTYMDSTYKDKGPKSLLYKSIKENRRIKVWTRSHSYVRSVCTGYLLAFDQYWNLAMIDVDEVYKVPLHKYKQPSEFIEHKDDLNLSTELDSVKIVKSDETIDETIEPKKAASAKIDEDESLLSSFATNINLYKSGKYNLFERHVNQLFIRGDNVVLVVLAD